MTKVPNVNSNQAKLSIVDFPGFNPGEADMTQTLIDAGDWAANRGMGLFLPNLKSLPVHSTYGRYYPVSDTVTWPYVLDVEADRYVGIGRTGNGDIGTPTIVLGDANNKYLEKSCKLFVFRTCATSQLEFRNLDIIGILIYGMYRCEEVYLRALGFAQGVVIRSANFPNAVSYNRIHLGKFNNNRYGFVLERQYDGSTHGWTNESSIFGGTFTMESNIADSGAGVPADLDYAHMVLRGNSNNATNCNKFYGTSLEAYTEDFTGKTSCILFEAAAINNIWHDVRHEQLGHQCFFRIRHPSVSRNHADILFAANVGNVFQKVDDVDDPGQTPMIVYDVVAHTSGPGSSQGVSNTITIMEQVGNNQPGQASHSKWTSGNLGDKSHRVTNAGNLATSGMHWRNGSTPSITSPHTVHHVRRGKSLVIQSKSGIWGFGVTINTAESKFFRVDLHYPHHHELVGTQMVTTLGPDDRRGRVILQALGEDGSVLDNHSAVLNAFNAGSPTLVVDGSGTITGLNLSAVVGEGYTGNVPVHIFHPTGTGADVTATVAGGVVTGFTVNDGGIGYANDSSLIALIEPPPPMPDVVMANMSRSSSGNYLTQEIIRYTHFAVSPRTKKVRVMVWVNQPNVCELESMEITCLDGGPVLVEQQEPGYELPWTQDKPVTPAEISFIDSNSVSGTSFDDSSDQSDDDMPTHEAGDLLLMFAYRDDSTTSITVPSGWEGIQHRASFAIGSNSNASTIAYKIAASSSETSGTWTGAVGLICSVYRGCAPFVGLNRRRGGSGTTATLDSLGDLEPGAWVAAFLGHSNTDTNIQAVPAGLGGSGTLRENLVGASFEMASFDSGDVLTSYDGDSLSLTGTSGNWYGRVVELLPNNWISGSGPMPQGQFLNLRANIGEDDINRQHGYLHIGDGNFRPIPGLWVSDTEPTDTDMVWINTS